LINKGDVVNAEKKKQRVNEVVKFLKKNWASTISLVISIIAVLISMQSNMYSRKASSSDILIEDIGELYNRGNHQTWYATVYGCDDDYSDGYVLHFNTGGEFWLSNMGGLDTTLLATYFVSDIDIYDSRVNFNKDNTWRASVYEHPNLYFIGDEINSVEIPAGKGLPVNVLADTEAYFPTVDAAIQYFQSLIGDSTQKLIDKRGAWIFRFSDGKTYSKAYDKADLRLMDYLADKPKTLKEQLETSCKVMDRKP
jgi:hypothetical protein